MAVSTTPVFTGSDINSLHKIQFTKHSELEYNPASRSHGSVSEKLGWVNANGNVWNVLIWFCRLDIPVSNHTRKHCRTQEKRVKNEKEIQESCVCNINVTQKLYRDMEIIIKSTWNGNPSYFTHLNHKTLLYHNEAY